MCGDQRDVILKSWGKITEAPSYKQKLQRNDSLY